MLDLAVGLVATILRVLLLDDSINLLCLQMIDVTPGGVFDGARVFAADELLQEPLRQRAVVALNGREILPPQKIAGVVGDKRNEGASRSV